MTPRISKLILAAVLAASLPAAAAADDCNHGQWRPAAPAPVHVAPAPRRWREAEWRERRLQKIRAELRALEAERAEFHALNAHRPGRLRKYDRWYLERRGELERRQAELRQQLAWR